MKTSYSSNLPSALTRSQTYVNRVLLAFGLLLSTTPIPSGAASAPPATLMYTTLNNASIHGGVATIGTIGTNAAIYFSTLSTASTKANVTALNTNGTLRWPSPFMAPGG